MLSYEIENFSLISNKKRKFADCCKNRTKGLAYISEKVSDIEMMQLARRLFIEKNWFNPVSSNNITLFEKIFYLLENGKYDQALYNLAFINAPKPNAISDYEAVIVKETLHCWYEMAIMNDTDDAKNDRDIPKKPLWGGHEDPMYADNDDEVICPVCGYGLGMCDEDDEYLKINKFCPNCGQAILWE